MEQVLLTGDAARKKTTFLLKSLYSRVDQLPWVFVRNCKCGLFFISTCLTVKLLMYSVNYDNQAEGSAKAYAWTGTESSSDLLEVFSSVEISEPK
jgi:hypothetical protein